MADPVIKKLIVPIGDLPPINSDNEGYTIRYRFISSDKNRTSHWSPIYLVQPGFTYETGEIAFNKSGSIAQIVWDSVTVTKVDGPDTYTITKSHEYDIWVRWDRGAGDGDWLYKERIDGTSILLPIPSTWTINGVVQPNNPNRLSVEIYLKGYPIERGNGPVGTPFLKMYILTNETV